MKRNRWYETLGNFLGSPWIFSRVLPGFAEPEPGIKRGRIAGPAVRLMWIWFLCILCRGSNKLSRIKLTRQIKHRLPCRSQRVGYCLDVICCFPRILPVSNDAWGDPNLRETNNFYSTKDFMYLWVLRIHCKYIPGIILHIFLILEVWGGDVHLKGWNYLLRGM